MKIHNVLSTALALTWAGCPSKAYTLAFTCGLLVLRPAAPGVFEGRPSLFGASTEFGLNSENSLIRCAALPHWKHNPNFR